MAKLMKLLTIIISIPLGLWCIFVLQVGFIFVIIGILPALVAYFVDTFEGKPTFKCVLFCNISGMIPTFTNALNSDSAAIAMQTLMGDLFNWFLVFGAAGCGYGLLLFSRILTQIVLAITDQARIEAFEKKQTELVEEWGEVVKVRQF